MAIYTSLAVSTVILNPSERCLQWSDDGQACITTKATVHIMVSTRQTLWKEVPYLCIQTPDPGINFSTPPDIKALRGDEQGEQPLGWFRTMIEPVRGQTHMWPSICQGEHINEVTSSLLVLRLGMMVRLGCYYSRIPRRFPS